MMNVRDIALGHDNEPRIVVLRGLPGSGKSTVAADLRATHAAAVVCRDIIREIEFHRQGVLAGWEENIVSQIELQQVSDHLAAGRTTVVIDSTNLANEHVRRWTGFAAARGVGCLVVDVHAPLDICVARAAARSRAGGRDVPADVIRALHHRYPPASWSPTADHRIGDPGPADITEVRSPSARRGDGRRANTTHKNRRGNHEADHTSTRLGPREGHRSVQSPDPGA